MNMRTLAWLSSRVGRLEAQRREVTQRLARMSIAELEALTANMDPAVKHYIDTCPAPELARLAAGDPIAVQRAMQKATRRQGDG